VAVIGTRGREREWAAIADAEGEARFWALLEARAGAVRG
jgi:hypothetical protein